MYSFEIGGKEKESSTLGFNLSFRGILSNLDGTGIDEATSTVKLALRTQATTVTTYHCYSKLSAVWTKFRLIFHYLIMRFGLARN